MCLCVSVCVIRPPVHVVCPNIEVVVFQPCKGTAQYLVSVASITHFIQSLPPHLLLPFSWISIFLSSVLLSPPSVIVRHCITSLYCTWYPHPLPARNAIHLDDVHTRHLTSSAAWLWSQRRVPASAAVSCVHLSPFLRPRPAPRSL